MQARTTPTSDTAGLGTVSPALLVDPLTPEPATRRSRERDLWFVISIICLGLFPRLATINQSPWFDEYLTILAADPRLPSIADAVATHQGSRQLPLYFYLTTFLYNLSPSIALLRMPSILFDIIKLLLFWQIAHRIVPPAVWKLGLILLVFAPMEIFTARDARLYSALMMCSMASIYGLYLLFREDRKSGFYWFLGASILSVQLSYFGFLAVGSHVLLAVCLALDRSWWSRHTRREKLSVAGKVGLGGLVTAVLFIPYKNWLIRWISRDLRGGSGNSDGLLGFNWQFAYEMAANLGYGIGTQAWVVLALIPLGVAIAFWRHRDLGVITIALFAGGLGPFFALLPLMAHPHFQVRYILFTQPFLLLCLAVALHTLCAAAIQAIARARQRRLTPRQTSAYAGVLSTVLAGMLGWSALVGSFKECNEDMRGMGELISNYGTDQDIVIVEQHYAWHVAREMAPGLPRAIAEVDANLEELKERARREQVNIWYLSLRPYRQLVFNDFITLCNGYSHKAGLAVWSPEITPQNVAEQTLAWRKRAAKVLRPSAYLNVLLAQAEYNVGNRARGWVLHEKAQDGLRAEMALNIWGYAGSSRDVTAFAYADLLQRRGDLMQAKAAYQEAVHYNPWHVGAKHRISELDVPEIGLGLTWTLYLRKAVLVGVVMIMCWGAWWCLSVWHNFGRESRGSARTGNGA